MVVMPGTSGHDNEEVSRHGGRGQLGYAIVCALLLTAGVFLFRDAVGTHRLPIHAVSIVLVVLYSILWRPPQGSSPWRELGLLLPADPFKWMSLFLLLGVVTGGVRFVVGRYLGGGGLDLYEREFPQLVAGKGMVESAARSFGF